MGTHPIFESDFDCLTVSRMSSNEEEEYEVDRIINDRVEKGEKQYLIGWKNFGADDDTWEPVSNLDCPEIIEAYERGKKAKTNEEKEKQDRIKRESYSRTNPTKEPAKKKSKKDDNAGPTGWKRGLNPEKIIGATDESGSLMFLMKWEGAELAELVPAKEANVKCPQIVIQFYEERLTWHSNHFNE